MSPLEDAGEGQVLRLSRCAREEALARLEPEAPGRLRGVDASLLAFAPDAEFVGALTALCGRLGRGSELRLAHSDLSSGTDGEQRLYDLKQDKAAAHREEAYFRGLKKKGHEAKDFGVSAKLRREAEEGTKVTLAKLAKLDEDIAEMERRRQSYPWHQLFSGLSALSASPIRRLDLADCELHATGLETLTSVLLDLEHRGEGEGVAWLCLDGNDLGDIATGSLASYLRLSSCVEALMLRNIGVTDQGLSQVLAGLVANKSLALLDLRGNGLASPDVSRAAVAGVQRFNKSVEIMLD